MKLFPVKIKVDQKNRLLVPKGIKFSPSLFDVEKKEEKIFDMSGIPETEGHLTLDGDWSLDEGHDLKFKITNIESPLSGKTVTFKGAIESADGDAFSFRVEKCNGIEELDTFKLTLSGTWCADKNNRITFKADKYSGKTDVMTFEGVWNISRTNELIYRYKRTSGKRSLDEETLVVFKGWWDLGDGNITYKLEYAKNSFISFSVSVRGKVLSAFDQRLTYEAGIKYTSGRSKRTVHEEVVIYGKWSIDRDFKVYFEVLYSSGTPKKLEFGAEKIIGDSNLLKVALVTNKGEKLGFQVEFSRQFKNNSEFFLALSKLGENVSIIGGLKVRF